MLSSLTSMGGTLFEIDNCALIFPGLSRRANPEQLQALRDATKAQTVVEAMAALSRAADSSLPFARRMIGAYLGSPNPQLRTACMKWLRANPAPKNFRYVSVALKDPDPSVRLAAVNTFPSVFSVGLLNRLREIAQTDTDPQIRTLANELIAPYDIPSLLKTLDSPNPPFAALHKLVLQRHEIPDSKLYEISKTLEGENLKLWEGFLFSRLKTSDQIPQHDKAGWMKIANSDGPVVLGKIAFYRVLKSLTNDELAKFAAHAGISEVKNLASTALMLRSISARFHTLYKEIPDEEQWNRFSKCEPICFRPFTKTGSELSLVGGQLAGKIVIRVIPNNSLLAWEVASKAKHSWHLAGFDRPPVEPILDYDRVVQEFGLSDDSQKQLAAHLQQLTRPGFTAVLTRVIPGPSLGDLTPLGSKLDNAKWERKREKITEVLRNLGIVHGHPHLFNFVLTQPDDPQIIIIDFDQASIDPI